MRTSPLRILMVCATMNRGGAETMIMNYYRHIDRHLVQFDFLLHGEEKSAYEEEIVQLGGYIFKLPSLRLNNIFSYRHALACFFDDHSEYKIIHIHAPSVSYFVAAEARKRNAPVIIQHSHSCVKNCFNWKIFLRHICKRITRPFLTHYFACGKDAAVWLFGKKWAKQAFIIPNAIDTARFRYDAVVRAEVREKMNWEGHYVIGNVANFRFPKNHFQLLTFFEEVLKRRPDALLVLVGEPSGYYQELKEKCSSLGIHDKVMFTGGRSDIPELLQGFDVFAFPSFFEGLGIAALEAQAAGLRVIASDGVPQEVAVIPERTYFLSLRASSSVWAEELLRPYERLDVVERICRAGYDIHQSARWLQKFYIEQAGKMHEKPARPHISKNYSE